MKSSLLVGFLYTENIGSFGLLYILVSRNGSWSSRSSLVNVKLNKVHPTIQDVLEVRPCKHYSEDFVHIAQPQYFTDILWVIVMVHGIS